MVVKAVLDPVEDERQIKFEIPWQSAPIEGVQGTFPMVYSIKSVASDNGHPEVASQFTVARKGVIELPWNHTVPPTLRVYPRGIKRGIYSCIGFYLYGYCKITCWVCFDRGVFLWNTSLSGI
ncbi:MAG: hypothetical protein V8R91_05700 [Butyricimonas faecihominis]